MEYDYTWTTASGDKIQIDDMTESHAKNVLKLLFRQIENYNTKIIKQKAILQSDISDRIWEEHHDSDDWRNGDYKYNHGTGYFEKYNPCEDLPFNN
jgi:hypothetical protein